MTNSIEGRVSWLKYHIEHDVELLTKIITKLNYLRHLFYPKIWGLKCLLKLFGLW
jgi:hypothetical protein